MISIIQSNYYKTIIENFDLLLKWNIGGKKMTNKQLCKSINVQCTRFPNLKA